MLVSMMSLKVAGENDYHATTHSCLKGAMWMVRLSLASRACEFVVVILMSINLGQMLVQQLHDAQFWRSLGPTNLPEGSMCFLRVALAYEIVSDQIIYVCSMLQVSDRLKIKQDIVMRLSLVKGREEQHPQQNCASKLHDENKLQEPITCQKKQESKEIFVDRFEATTAASDSETIVESDSNRVNGSTNENEKRQQCRIACGVREEVEHLVKQEEEEQEEQEQEQEQGGAGGAGGAPAAIDDEQRKTKAKGRQGEHDRMSLPTTVISIAPDCHSHWGRLASGAYELREAGL
jgi:hypothetical protein